MFRIGATISGFEQQLFNTLAATEASIATRALRLSTGEKLQSPKDDPSAYLALSQQQDRLRLAQAALTNAQKAATLGTAAQSTISQIKTELNSIRTTLVTDETQSLTTAQRETAQATIDTAINSINQLAGTEVEGKRLFDGSIDFQTSGQNTSQVQRLQVFQAEGSPTISGTVTSAATQAQLTYTGSSGNTTAAATITLNGDLGSSSINVTNGQTLTSLATTINLVSHKTGVTANASGDTLTLSSVNYGTQADVGVTVASGTFAVAGGNGDGTANGTDAVATINNQSLTGDGNRFSVRVANHLQFELEVASGYSGSIDSISVSNEATLQFALSTDLSRTDRLGVKGVQAAQLRGLSGSVDQLATGGSLAGLNTNTAQAIRVIDEALDQLALVEGQIDGFTNSTVGAQTSLLTDLTSNLEDSISSINSVSEAEERALLAREQLLATNVISSLAVLHTQRQSITDLLKSVAGLG